jgi:hypothetical protein
MQKSIFGFLINITIIFLIIYVIKIVIPNIEYNFNFFQISLQENIAFLLYFLLYGFASKYYFSNETIGDFLITNNRNKNYIEKNTDILTKIVRLYFIHMVRIIFDLLLFTALKILINYLKSKRNKTFVENKKSINKNKKTL